LLRFNCGAAIAQLDGLISSCHFSAIAMPMVDEIGKYFSVPALEAARAALFDGIVEDAGLEQVMGWSTRTKNGGYRTARLQEGMGGTGTLLQERARQARSERALTDRELPK
jgi:hypothetical protein